MSLYCLDYNFLWTILLLRCLYVIILIRHIINHFCVGKK